MKLVNMLIGFVMFSVVVSMFFLATADILKGNDIEGYETFEELGGKYKSIGGDLTKDDSTVRDMQSASQLGEGTGTDDPEVKAYEGVLSAGKMPINFIINFENIIHNATGDINTEEQTYIHPTIRDGIIAVIIIIIVLITIHFIWRFKTET